MTRTTFLSAALLGLLVVGGLGLRGTSTAAQQSELDQAREPEALVFTKPVLVMGEAGGACTLKMAQLRTLGDREFLVGPAMDSSYTKNSFGEGQVWIPLEDVSQLVEIDPAHLQ